MRQLTSLDAQFLAMETPRQYGHVGGLAVYDPTTAPGGHLTVKDVCRLVSERLHLLPPFRWKLVEVPFGLDHPYWIEDPDFDLDFHIRESAIPPPGDERQLADVVARIFARPLDRAHPLWELYVIHGLPDGHVGILTKIHHAAVDGVSGAEILSVLLDPSPEGRDVPPAQDRSGERRPGQLEMLGRGISGLPRQPLRALRTLPTALAHAGELPGLDALPGGGLLHRANATARRVLPVGDGGILEQPRRSAPVPRTRFNGRSTPHRRFSFGSVSLDTIKRIKNKMGISVNDVVVALCATALREWLLAHDELPDEPLVAMVPVSVRTQEQIGTFGNRVSMMVVPIPTDVADPRERLQRAHEIMRGAKERHSALPAELLADFTQFIPPAVHARATRAVLQIGSSFDRLRPPLNLVISNVPGPRFPLFLAGAKLVTHYPVSAITDGMGLNITCMSYLDHVDFGIVVDRGMVDDAWPMLETVRDSLDELERVICDGGRPRRRGGRRAGTRKPPPVEAST